MGVMRDTQIDRNGTVIGQLIDPWQLMIGTMIPPLADYD